MKTYIKSTTSNDTVEEVLINDGDIIDVSSDPDDTEYTLDSFEDYEYFVHHVKL